MRPEQLDCVLANLYPGALRHVEGWGLDRLDSNAHVVHSSQALCLSVFGTIAESERCAELMQLVLSEAGIAGISRSSGTPTIECEVRDDWQLLRERGGRHSTCPDVLVTWDDAVLTLESKFTERLDRCSQVKRRKRRNDQGATMPVPACTGNYEAGSDLITDSPEPCRLTIVDGQREPRRYWEIASSLFLPEVVCAPQRPCPFADGRHQLMRNLCYAAALADRRGVDVFGFVLVHSRAAGSSAGGVFDRFRRMLLPDVADRVGSVTYERIAELLGASASSEDIRLSEWLSERLRRGAPARSRTAF
jgi:hypothetical protein